MTDYITDYVSEIVEPAYSPEVLPLKIFFFLISFFLAGVILISFLRTRWVKRGPRKELVEFWSTKPYESTVFKKKWSSIKKRLEKGWESEAKLAVLEADELLEEVLDSLSYEGETFEEKLDLLTSREVKNLEEVKRTRRLREDIVHDPSYHLSLDKAKWAVEVYREALSDLNAF